MNTRMKTRLTIIFDHYYCQGRTALISRYDDFNDDDFYLELIELSKEKRFINPLNKKEALFVANKIREVTRIMRPHAKIFLSGTEEYPSGEDFASYIYRPLLHYERHIE